MRRFEDVVRRARPLLGTVVSLEVDRGRADIDANAALDAAFEAVERVHRSMSFHSGTSDLTRLNRAAVGAVVSVDPWLVEVVRAALQLYRGSGGVFDPGIAPVLRRRGRLPGGAGDVDAHGSSIGALDVVDDLRLVKRRAVTLDLGGIAKGFAVDVAVHALRERGVASGVVNAGGDLRVFGSVARSVVLRHPIETGLHSTPFELREMACCSSVSEGVSPNCVDPRFGTSWPETIAATVIAPRAVSADGLTKVAILEGVLNDELARAFEARLIHRESFKTERCEMIRGARECA